MNQTARGGTSDSSLVDYLAHRVKAKHAVVLPAANTTENKGTPEATASAVARLKYWIYTNAVEKRVGSTLVTGLNFGKLLKLLSAKTNSSSRLGLKQTMQAAAEFEIDVHFSEAHLQYSHLMRKCSQDFWIETARREAKRAALQTFYKAHRVRAGSPEYFEETLRKLTDNCWDKDKMIINTLEGKPPG